MPRPTRPNPSPAGARVSQTFHLAGVGSKNVTLGIPRFKEILDFSRNIRTPCTTIRLVPPFACKQEICEQFAATLVRTKLAAVVKSTQLLHEPGWFSTDIEADRPMLAMDAYFAGPVAGASEWVCRLQLDKTAMKARCLTPPILQAVLQEKLEDRVHIIGSETNAVEWAMRLRFIDVRLMISQGFATPAQGDMEVTLAQRVCAMLLDKVTVSGHPGVTGASVRDVQVWNEERGGDEVLYVVDAFGSVLESLGAIDAVDWPNTVTNDIAEAVDTLGIEAAAAVMLHEIETTISFDGTYVDRRHLNQVVNTMTRGGYVMAISRHGINRVNTGPLVRSSFEETADVLYDAALFGEHDDAKAVSHNVMTGQMSAVGTGSFDLLMPQWALPASGTISERQTKLAKSRVRSSAQVSGSNGIEYVDERLWAFRGGRDSAGMLPPFLDTRENGAGDEPPAAPANSAVDGGSSSSAATDHPGSLGANRHYEQSPGETTSLPDHPFVPSTPPKVVEMRQGGK